MAMYRTGTSANVVNSIIGKDLDAGAIFNADVKKSQAAILKAGTIMKYDATNKELDKDSAAAAPFGVLAQDCDATSATETVAAMVYRRGVFLRQEVESANNTLYAPGGTADVALKDVGIFLELSYDAYDNLTPVPAGAVTTPPYH